MKQFVFLGKKHGCGPAGIADLIVNMLQVMGDGPFADDEFFGNLAVGVPHCYLLQNLDFTDG